MLRKQAIQKLKTQIVTTACNEMFESMTDKQAFEIADYPKDGRLAKFEKELSILEKAQDKEGILTFSKNLFDN